MICVSSSCKRIDDEGVDPEFEATGQLIGFDLTLCACCGGYLLDVDGEDENYNFISLPDDHGLVLDNAVFPMDVKFNWTKGVSESCPKIVSIESIEAQ